jgi:nucleotide-binding universal stress UspA family protein
MKVIVATDGSKQSLDAARLLKEVADPAKVSEIIVVAVLSPLASVPFANDLSGRRRTGDVTGLSFREEARAATSVIAGEYDGWGPKVSKRLRSGSPAAEIVKLAEQVEADLIVIASGGRGLSDTILLGSTATRVQHSAPCPVLLARRTPRTPQASRRSR